MPEAPAHPGLLLGIARFYYSPRGSMRGLLSSDPTDGRLLGYFLVGMAAALGLMLMRLSVESPVGSEVFMARAPALIVWFLIAAPLLSVLVAGLATLICRAFGGVGSWQQGRAAFFWAILATIPVWALTMLLAEILREQPRWVSAAIIQFGEIFPLWALAQCFAEAFDFTRTWLVFAIICTPIALIFAAFQLSG